MTRKIAVLLFPMLTLAASVEAQTADWMRKVKTGKAIFVTTTAGEEIAGRAGDLGAGGITVLTAAGPRVVSIADIHKVQQHDRPWTGAVAGGVWGGLTVLGAVSKLCSGEPRDPECNIKNIIPGALVYAGVPTLIGWGLDVLVKKRRTIYDSQTRSRASLFIKGRMVGLAFVF